MWPTTDFFSWLVHLGFALTAGAWLVRDILLLRLLAIASYLVFSSFILTTQAAPSLTYLSWYCGSAPRIGSDSISVQLRMI